MGNKLSIGSSLKNKVLRDDGVVRVIKKVEGKALVLADPEKYESCKTKSFAHDLTDKEDWLEVIEKETDANDTLYLHFQQDTYLEANVKLSEKSITRFFTAELSGCSVWYKYDKEANILYLRHEYRQEEEVFHEHVVDGYTLCADSRQTQAEKEALEKIRKEENECCTRRVVLRKKESLSKEEKAELEELNEKSKRGYFQDLEMASQNIYKVSFEKTNPDNGLQEEEVYSAVLSVYAEISYEKKQPKIDFYVQKISKHSLPSQEQTSYELIS